MFERHWAEALKRLCGGEQCEESESFVFHSVLQSQGAGGEGQRQAGGGKWQAVLAKLPPEATASGDLFDGAGPGQPLLQVEAPFVILIFLLELLKV